ncbi:hypothetical protein LTV02_10290 [Nocardia yamanashiensis]|uniref:SMP-30/gluconolactonase/LRE family protein n=1 Tax=Nocardia yamanashiensis TaxID=209247 RepID=UPI001E566114|nr:hypothetical protein [Nocardia yamanashiensis]UGT43741.1 hypothetical protein LTV02_10290 [Nocardia yamanashiensis]
MRGSRRLRTSWLVAAIAAGIVVGQPNAQASPFAPDCSAGWDVSTVMSGRGELENLDSDGRGGFYVTTILAGELLHVAADGTVETLAAGFDHPAGVRFDGRYVYFVTGDDFSAAPGQLYRYDTTSGELVSLLSGLSMANGLLLLPDGDLLIANSSFAGEPQGISRYRPSTGEYTKAWSSVQSPNGLALSEDGTAIYVSSLIMQIQRVPLDNPRAATFVTGVPKLLALPDDMQATRSGLLFFGDHGVGAVYRTNTATGETCSIIEGLIKPSTVRIPPDGVSSVRIARDGDGWSLYVTAMDGVLRRLRPPPGIDLTPVADRPGS